MIEWTTPTQELVVTDADITEMDVYVTIAQGTQVVTLRPDSMSYDEDTGTTLTVDWTQAQTGALVAGTAKVQVNVVDSEGYRAATQQKRFVIGSNLLDEEVSYVGD